MDDPVTRVTRLAVVTLPAAQAVRHPLDRNVLVARQGSVAHPAAEVLQVPEPLLRRRELHREDELVTGGAPGDVHLVSKVAAAVKLAVTVVIEKILKQRVVILLIFGSDRSPRNADVNSFVRPVQTCLQHHHLSGSNLQVISQESVSSQ